PRVAPGSTDYAGPITQALRLLTDSYLAVQGPPGTGKTHVGAHVIAALVADGWRVGVVAQSHKVVENLLAKVIDAGVDGALVAKMRHGDTGGGWTETPTAKYAAFLDEHRGTGCVVGGTAWTFSNATQVQRTCLDLLVVDEAGQFSLANTLAVSVAARRLLLLGDPQQLPQVSQGTHPEPVDVSALGWLTDGHDTLPTARGYFLERTWRMHPELCAPVSRLSYEGRLHAQESVAAARSLEGRPPGIAVVDVAHRGNSVESVEESAEVVSQMRGLVGLPWVGAPGATPRPLAPEDVLVVAPFNAQVGSIRRHLSAAGIDGVRVGTVDRFQGQQAPVVIVSMTVSAADDVPRGMSFVLSRNRLNVAVSRGQWCAVVVRSDVLTDFLPSTPEGLAELGAFVALCDGAG
ncbi:MAG: DEAD/DEAH box helicase, partial [Nocardioidaceae bacterium]